MLLPALAKAKQKAYQANCTSNLKQCAYAISMYTQDFNDLLPGPCWTGMFCVYMDYDPSAPTTTQNPNKYFGALAAYITTYLATKAPSTLVQTSKAMICPAGWQKIPPGQSYTPPTSVPVLYFSPDTIYSDPINNTGLLFHYPFGRPNGGIPPPPLLANGSSPQHKVTEIPRLSDQWAMTDADKTNVPTGATYYGWLPDQPVHGSGKPVLRNYLYFDFHVASKKTPL
jgi:prepilin-type processing-associated H-X9-DG protein